MIDFDDIFPRKKFDYKIFLVIIGAFLVGAYILNLMFGDRSFSRMLDLEKNVKILEKRVKDLKHQNALLQKEYFELKELEGE